MKDRLAIILIIITISLSCNNDKAGKFIVKSIPAPSLKGSLLGDRETQDIAVYLPPSYYSSGKRYPVIYFLSNFPGNENMFDYWKSEFTIALNDDARSDDLKRIVEYKSKKNRNEIKNYKANRKSNLRREMIIVIISEKNLFGGSFYLNSPVIGRWEDFVFKDSVGFVDRNFRTIPDSGSRGIAGNLDGASAALRIAMEHPEIFCSCYLQSFSYSGFSKIFNDKYINNMVDLLDKLRKEAKNKSDIKYLTDKYITCKTNWSSQEYVNWPRYWEKLLIFAFGVELAPNPNAGFPFFDFPYKRINGKLIVDEEVKSKWKNGTVKIEDGIKTYHDNLIKLKGIVIDCPAFIGDYLNDTHIEDSKNLSVSLMNNEIPHEFAVYEARTADGEDRKNGARIENKMLPFFSGVLEFE